MAEKISAGDKLRHDTALEDSYGAHIPQPNTVKGTIRVLGELAGSESGAKSLVPERTTFGDSVAANRKNQPKSH